MSDPKKTVKTDQLTIARNHDGRALAHWTKSDQTPQYLSCHLQNVGALSKSFSKKIHLKTSGELVGLLHDLGKYSEEFCNYIHSTLGLLNPDEDDYVDSTALKGKLDHSSAGAHFVWRELAKKGTKESLIGQWLALCIASHHSGLIDCLDPEGRDIFGKRMKKLDEKVHLNEVKLRAIRKYLSGRTYCWTPRTCSANCAVCLAASHIKIGLERFERPVEEESAVQRDLQRRAGEDGV